MANHHTVDPERQSSHGTPVSTKWRRVLKWSTITVTVVACVVSLLLCLPIAEISPETSALITAGMTDQQASAIVGAPPGWYDGIVMISTNPGPSTKGIWREWTGSRGRLVLDPDTKGRVARATFYPAVSVEQSLRALMIERLTRNTELQWQLWWQGWWIYDDHA